MRAVSPFSRKNGFTIIQSFCLPRIRRTATFYSRLTHFLNPAIISSPIVTLWEVSSPKLYRSTVNRKQSCRRTRSISMTYISLIHQNRNILEDSRRNCPNVLSRFLSNQILNLVPEQQERLKNGSSGCFVPGRILPFFAGWPATRLRNLPYLCSLIGIQIHKVLLGRHNHGLQYLADRAPSQLLRTG